MNSYDQNQECVYVEDCRHCNNAIKCNRCTNNPFNFEVIERYGEGRAHERSSKAYFNFTDNYDPI